MKYIVFLILFSFSFCAFASDLSNQSNGSSFLSESTEITIKTPFPANDIKKKKSKILPLDVSQVVVCCGAYQLFQLPFFQP